MYNLKEDGEQTLIDLLDLGDEWSQNLRESSDGNAHTNRSRSPYLTDVDVEDIGGSAFTEETAEKSGDLRTEHIDSIYTERSDEFETELARGSGFERTVVDLVNHRIE